MKKQLVREGLFDTVWSVLDYIDSILDAGKAEYLKRELDKIEQKYGSTGVAADINKYVNAKGNTVQKLAKKSGKKGDKEYEEVLRAMGVSESKIRQIMNS